MKYKKSWKEIIISFVPEINIKTFIILQKLKIGTQKAVPTLSAGWFLNMKATYPLLQLYPTKEFAFVMTYRWRRGTSL